MAFDLEIPDHIAAYLDGLEVSQGVRGKIADALEFLADLPAAFRADPTNRYPNSTLLRFSYLFTDGDRRVHTIAFAVDDRSANFGILRIPHARYTVGPPVLPPPPPPPETSA